MKGGKVPSCGEPARTAAIGEHGEGQQAEPGGPAPGNTEATPVLHPDSDGPLVASPTTGGVGSSASCLKVRLAYLRLPVASEVVVCNEPQSARNRL